MGQLKQWLGLAFFVLLIGYALWPWIPLPGKEAPPQSFIVYGFSILEGAMVEGIFPAFKQRFFEESGKTIEPIGAFGGSGVITSQIVMGAPAQVAILATELDALRLAEAGRVENLSWRKLPYEGVVNLTPFVILVREGNPLNIRSFEDLTLPGVKIVHPDPLTSGGALWAVVAEYGAGLQQGGPQGAYDLLLGVWRNVVTRASSARSAKTQFDQGFGDVLVTYEQEALRPGSDEASQIVLPRGTVLAENTAVVVSAQISEGDREVVDAFLRFLWTEEAQRIFTEHGFRSVLPQLKDATLGADELVDAFTIDELGGWQRVQKEVIQEVWIDRVLKELEP